VGDNVYIKYMRLQNYRLFKDVELNFHERANYLVGENNIGKSSFLRLLSLISSGFGILEHDYADTNLPIVIIVEICLLDDASEHFSDSKEGVPAQVRLRMEKRVDEIFPRLYNDADNSQLPLDLIRRIRYIYHSETRNDDYLVSDEIYNLLKNNILKSGQIEEFRPSPDMAQFIQQQERYSEYDTSFYMNVLVLSKLLSRQDRPRADNLKFISLVALKILSHIYVMYHSKAVPFEHTIIVDSRGKRFLSIFVAIDEPEIHLHPYMQRSILTYYKQLLQNEDPAFCGILKSLFNIDGLRGQLFIVTHSTDSLVDDYRNIIRFYRNNGGCVQAACGVNFHFNEEIEKHLIMHFPEVKEALYSRSVIIVEGETEYGCFQLFGTTLDLRFDYYGICLINARGESSISKIKKLLQYFRIPTVALYDADVKGSREAEKNVFFTDEICFEMDLVKAMIDKGKRRSLDHIIYTAGGVHGKATADMLKKACRKLDINYHNYPPRMLENVNPRNVETMYVYYFAWLYSNKGVILGRLIGQSLTKQEIPPSFTRVIKVAGQLAKVDSNQEC